MSLDKILEIASSSIEELFSDSSLYDSARNAAIEKYDSYCKSHNIEDSYPLLNDFINESVLSVAISTSVKETITALFSCGLLPLDD